MPALERDIIVTGPFEAPVSVDHVTYFETLGQPFTCELDLESESPDIDLSSVVGQSLTVAISLGENGVRFVNGYVTHLSLAGTFDRRARYHATVRPWLFLMSGRRNSRIFQQKSVVDVAKDLFREHGFADFEESLDETYDPKDYIVQYQESDLAFVSRLLEGAGIYYYFRHEDGKHTLVLSDSISGHQTIDGYEEIAFHSEGSGRAEADETISRWQVTHQWKSGAFATTDYDFEKPRANLLSASNTNARHAWGDLEVFDFPGGFTVAADGSTRARIRLEELQSDVELAHGGGDVRGIGTGNLFALTEYPSDSQNKKYLVVASSFSGTNASHDSGDGEGGEWAFSFAALDADVPFRTPLATPRPRVQGPQTALVVGPDGDEIHVDKYGRVKVQFHWDREGKDDENSSCWVRVSQAWAGEKWGSVHIPRIGQEVIIDFLEGDPDHPIITGRVYNNDQMPPYDLPDNKTQSGIKSRSTPKGGPNNFNEIRFEDKKGSEELFIQAEKTQTTNVKGSQSISVAGSRSISVGGDESTSVTGNRSATITKNETQTFKADRKMNVTGTNTDEITGAHTGTYHAGRTETVEKGDTLTVQGSDKTVTVHGNYNTVADTQFQVTQGPNKLLIKDAVDIDSQGKIHVHNPQCSVTLDGGKLTIQAAEEISLNCGGATITLKKDGTVEINGSQKVAATGGGSGIELAAAGAKMSGTKATISGTAMTEVTGAIVKIN